MAVYEYLCPGCRTEFELMRPMSQAERPAICPGCGSNAQRLVSGFGSKTGSYLQPPEKPFRGRITTKASTAKARAARTTGTTKRAKKKS